MFAQKVPQNRLSAKRFDGDRPVLSHRNGAKDAKAGGDLQAFRQRRGRRTELQPTDAEAQCASGFDEGSEVVRGVVDSQEVGRLHPSSG